MGEQDVDRDVAAGIEIDGGDMALVMGDLDDPAIDDRYVAARQIGPDVRRNVMTIGEDGQPVGPIPEQPGGLVRLRAGPDEAPMLSGGFKAVAIRARHDGRAPAFSKARNIRHLVGDAIAQDQTARPNAFTIAGEDGEIVDGAGDAVDARIDQRDRGITRQLLPRLGQDVQRWLVIVAEQAMRVAGEAIARQAGIEDGDLAAGAAELGAAARPAKLPPMMMTSFMVIGSVVWTEGVETRLSACSFAEHNQDRRGRPANGALPQTIVDAACELFVELGFQATTMDKVAQRAKIIQAEYLSALREQGGAVQRGHRGRLSPVCTTSAV